MNTPERSSRQAALDCQAARLLGEQVALLRLVFLVPVTVEELIEHLDDLLPAIRHRVALAHREAAWRLPLRADLLQLAALAVIAVVDGGLLDETPAG